MPCPYITALVAIFTCILGIFLKEWLDRAKPLSIIHFVGFNGDTAPIEISDELRRASIGSANSPRLRRFESYKKLEAQHQTLLRAHARLKLALLSVGKWKNEHRNWENTSLDQQFGPEDLQASPIAEDEVIFRQLGLNAGRMEVESGPVSLEALQKLPTISDLKVDDNGMTLFLRDRQIEFKFSRPPGSQAHLQFKQLALSIAHGSQRNIFHYMKQFEISARKSVQEIEDFLKWLEAVLMPNSHVTVGVSLCNYGARPMVIRPFGRLEFDHEDLKGHAMTLAFEASVDSETGPRGADANETEDEGDEVQVRPLLPGAQKAQYIVLAPRSSMRVSLRSTAPLGDAGGKKVKDYYESSLLKCSLTLLSLEGKQIRSPLATFGTQANPKDEQLLRRGKAGH